MKKSALLLLLVVILIATAVPLSNVTAQQPLPGTPQDNACNIGGTMEGKCDTQWEWTCGWYVAQWFNKGGWNTANNTIPDWCLPDILLPPKPPPSTPDPTEPATVCDNFNTNADRYCLTQNVGEIDLLRDGSINRRDLILPANTTTCPVPYQDGPVAPDTVAVAYAGAAYANVRALLLSKGYGTTRKVCIDNLP